MAIVKDLGMVTAYAYAVAGGYEGTEQEFEEMLGQTGVTLEQLENLSAVAVTLAPGSEATASYENGVLTFGIPQGAKGDKGDKGNKGDTGNGIASIAKTGTSGLADTYAITFTDGTTTTFTVTNGADGDITNVAQAFDATEAYSVGDMVLYQGALYAFTAAHAAGAWVGSDAQAVILAGEVTDLKNDYEKAKKYRVYVEGTITDAYLKQTNLSDYAQSAGMYLTALVTGGDTYYVSGTCVNTFFPLVIMVDSNESVIDSIYTSDFDKVDDKEITFPDNCAKVYINGRIDGEGANYPSIYKYAYSNDIMAEIVDDVQKKQSISYTWKEAESEKVVGSYVYLSSGKINFRTFGGYVYHKIAYDPSKIYRFWGGCYAPTIPAVICCDSSDRIIKLYGTTEGEVYKGQTITGIPQTTQRIYVNGKNAINGVDVATERSVISFVSQKIGVALGDSITQGANVYVSNTITPYKDYPTIASEQLGCKIYNGGLGGGAYSGGRSIDFVNVANCIVTGDYTSIIAGIDQYSLNQSAKVQYADIADLDFNEVDFITLSYGTNDWNFGRTISEITTAMISGISALLTTYPHLKIYVFTPIFRFNVGGSGQDSDTYVNATSGLTLPQACEAIKTCANNLCLPCKDMYHESNINPYTKVLYMGDDTHPNADGYALMGEKVARFINSH